MAGSFNPQFNYQFGNGSIPDGPNSTPPYSGTYDFSLSTADIMVEVYERIQAEGLKPQGLRVSKMKKIALAIGLLLAIFAPSAHAQYACSQLTQQALLAEFSDTQPAGSIVPRYVRNFICSTTLTLPNIAALRNNVNIQSSLYILGYASAGDGGQGQFTFNPVDTTSSDNGGTIIVDAAAHRWYRAPQGYLDASFFGVFASNASNDVALSNALAACSTVGGTLQLPPGTLTLTGAGSTTSTIKNCKIVGAGFPAGTQGFPASMGTTIALTSTTVKPFIIGSNWAIDGVNFYWPNQTTGTTSYPPLFSDDGVHQANLWTLDHVNIINAYDGFVQTPTIGWGAYLVSNSYMWAVHDLWRVWGVGDMDHLTNVHMTPGPWLSICNFTCQGAVNAGAAVNSIWHVTAKSGVGFQLQVSNSDSFAWRYGFKIDSGGEVGASIVDMAWDGTETMIDSSSGGSWDPQNQFRGSNAGCSQANYGGGLLGNAPCFNLGANGGLQLAGFHVYGLGGSFIVSAGASVYAKGLEVDGVGAINDGGTYYLINLTANNGTQISLEDSRSSGSNNIHDFGINLATTAQTLTVQNSEFQNFEQTITAPTSPGITIITGNQSQSTLGSTDVSLGGAGAVQHWNNIWSKPPNATCGTGCASVAGGLAGIITVSATNPTTSVAFTLPFSPSGGLGGNCTFTPSLGTIISMGPSGAPPVWTLNFAADVHNQIITYSCPGVQ